MFEESNLTVRVIYNDVIKLWLCYDSMFSMLDCQSRGSGLKSQPGLKFGSRFLLLLRPLTNSAMMSTLTVHCQWEHEMVRERTGHLPSYAEAEKMKSITLHIHGCPRASLRADLHHLLLLQYGMKLCRVGWYQN